MQSAIGRIQLTKMPTWQKKRAENAERIFAIGRRFNFLTVPEIPNYMQHAQYKCYVQVNSEMLPVDWSRDKIIKLISSKGIPCYSGSCSEVYKERAFEHTNYRPHCSLINAKKLGEESLMFLVHPTLTDDEITLTCKVIKEVFTTIDSE